MVNVVKLLVFMLLVVSPFLYANNQVNFNIPQYKYNFKNFKHKGIEATTTSITQDNKGLMWIGTQNGLTKFDGYESTMFENEPNNTSSLSSNFIISLSVDLTGNIWVGTNYGLNIIKATDEKVIRANDYDPKLAFLSKIFINTVFCDEKGIIWIGTDEGIYLYDPSDKKVVSLLALTKNNSSFQAQRVLDITFDQSIFLLSDKEVFVIDDDLTMKSLISTEQISNKTTIFRSFHIHQNKIYLGTSNEGLYIFDLATKTIAKSSLGPQGNDIRSITQDGYGTIWAATANGVLILKKDPTQSLYITMQNLQFKGLNTNYLTSVFVDSENLVWLGSHESGVYVHSPNNNIISTIPIMGELIQGGARTVAMALDNEENAWLAGKEYLIKLDFQQHKMTVYHEPEVFQPAFTYGLTYDKKRNRLYSATNSGISTFDLNTKQFSYFQPYENHKSGYGIFSDSKDRLWIGGYASEGISVFELSTGNRIKHIPAPKVFSFLEIETHILAFTRDGLYLINKANFTLTVHKPNKPHNISHNSVTGGLVDSKNRLWIATSGGLNLHKGHSILENSYQHFTDSAGFSSNVMTGPVEDNQGYLWVPTVNGLNRFSPENFKAMVFGTNEGAAKSYYVNAYLKLADGKLLFNSGQSGISIIEPDYSLPKKLISSPFISNIYSELGNINETRQLSLSIASTNYFTPEEMRYRYQLLGFDKSWIEVDANRRLINYTNIPPKHYTLNIQAANGKGPWSESLNYHFQVTPKFYERISFKILLFLMFSLCIYLLYKIRFFVLKKRNKELEFAVSERTKKIEEQKYILQEMAIKDSLTSLNNRYFLESQVSSYLNQAIRNQEENPASGIAIFIVDIDHFKQVNDDLGHDTGDKVLIQFSNLLKKNCRASDLIVRWGGEEFVIISHYSNSNGASELAERIRASTEQMKFFYNNNQWIKITCSMGFYCFPGTSNQRHISFNQILKIADKALYAMKSNGRNAWLGIINIKQELDKNTDLKEVFTDLKSLKSNRDFKVCSSLFKET